MIPERIGLALSGGGFRATLFHLGVLRFLHEARLLERVRFIGGVSGGSILAMHAGLHWARYTGRASDFEEAAREIVDFCRLDVRNRILRRWLFGSITVLPRILLGWSRTRLLTAHYERLFGSSTLNDLLPSTGIPRPRIIAQSVSLTTGQPCSFGRSGFMWYELDEFLNEREVSKLAPHLPIALAVTASSAFPPMFPPVRITARLLHVAKNEFPNAQYVTDGGVYDNLGIERPLWYFEQHDELDAFLISDAGGLFGWDFGRFSLTLPRNMRATDLLMKRVGDLVHRRLADWKGHVFLQLRIGATTDSLEEGALPPAVQRRVGGVRTDLDAFSDLEIDSLVRHGYGVARAQTVAHGWVAGNAPQSAWSPVDRVSIAANDWAESLRSSARRRTVPLFSLRDWPGWAAAAAIGAGALVAYGLWG